MDAGLAGLTALDPRENDFDNMLRCVKELKEGKSVMKPIYNHVNGTLDEDEKIEPTPIIIFEVSMPTLPPRFTPHLILAHAPGA